MAERFVIANGIRDLLGYAGVPEGVGIFVAWALLALILTGAILAVGGLMSFVMRKTMARIQTRYGPNRVGPFGLLQFLADGVKFISKEDILPARADPWGYRIGPFLMILPIILSFAPLPFAPGIVVTDVRMGLLFVLAVSAVSPVAEMVAGWASNNKYSMYGALRAAAMDVAYEVPLILTALSTILLVSAMGLNGLNFTDIVNAQDATAWFVVLQPIGAFIFFLAALAKAGVVPSDLAEAESELVSGYLTEYSGMRFGVFFVGVFVNIVLISVLTVLLFFGGWSLPGLSLASTTNLVPLASWIVGALAVMALIAAAFRTDRPFASLALWVGTSLVLLGAVVFVALPAMGIATVLAVAGAPTIGYGVALVGLVAALALWAYLMIRPIMRWSEESGAVAGFFLLALVLSAVAFMIGAGIWAPGFLVSPSVAAHGVVMTLFGLLVFVSKVAFFVLFVLLTWFTLPRFAPAQFLALGWKVLFPLSLLNLIVTLIEIRYLVPALGGA